MNALTYNPAIFNAADEAQAKAIILTPEGGLSTEARWERETPHLADLVAETLAPAQESLILDFGCGIGRLAKALIGRFGCRVLGVDLSEDMRVLAPRYVGSDRFSVVSPAMLSQMTASGLRVDGALAIWVVQHCLHPQQEIETLANTLKPGAGLVVVNNLTRAIPTREKTWANDGVDVRQLLRSRFAEAREGQLDPAVVSPLLTRHSFWGCYR